MKRLSVEQHLASAPPRVRQSMLLNRSELEPGASAVVGRFFSIVAARREPAAAPSALSFREAARSEPTFRALLRTLARHAPQVSTAAALPVKAEWVARRPKPAKASTHKKEKVVSKAAALIDIRSWPPSWQALYAGLEKAHIKPSSLKRYRASINRCAQLVAAGQADEELTFLNAWHLAEALPASRRNGSSKKDLRPVTVANYIEGLVVLGRHGGADPEAINGVRFVRDHLNDVADAGDKLKYGRITDIMEKGGFAFIAETIGALREEAAALPDHSARKTAALQGAVLCALHMNKPARTGDVSRWRIGEEIIREIDGMWRLGWEQEKTEHKTEAGDLWDEVGEILDEHILGGRPRHLIHLRYRELIGKNLMTLADRGNARNWPSSMIKSAIGIPSHDLRTLAADYLRLHDPETAADVIATHLGHKTRAAGEDYRAVAEGDAAARSWAGMRVAIGKKAR